MKKVYLFKIFFYIQLISLLVAILFFDVSYLILLKILALITIIIIYGLGKQKNNYFYLSSMLVMMINDVLISIDFSLYFPVITSLGTLYFALSIFVIKRFLQEKDIIFSKLYSFPIVVGVFLMGYLIYSITDLVLPYIENSLLFLILFIISLLVFVVLCFLIYLADRFTGNLRLFIAASCCLIVNALLPINYFVYQTKVFVLLIHILELLGFYFFTLFLTESKEKKDVGTENFFL